MKFYRLIAVLQLSILLLWGGAVPALAAEEAALRVLGKAQPLTAADFGADAVWTSSDETVAGVSSGGLVTAWAAGTAEISVLARDGRTEVFSLRVEPALAGERPVHAGERPGGLPGGLTGRTERTDRRAP